MNKLNKSLSQIWQDNYVIPLYQRNYAWKEEQIQQLLQDIYDNHKQPDSHYYIGSLVVMLRADGTYEVIDGQQRLTTLHLICRALNLLDSPRLSYDSRPEVEEFFSHLFRSVTIQEFLEDSRKWDNRKVRSLVEAVDIVGHTEIHTSPGTADDQVITLLSPEFPVNDFKEYLNNNVILVRTLLPADTDVAAYFEIMNNRGEQLQEHEIVKALLMAHLNDCQRAVFSTVWDACSQMTVPIQKGLSVLRNSSNPLFGPGYDGLNLEALNEYSLQDKMTASMTIDEVLDAAGTGTLTDGEEAFAENRYEPIIDFPNFLMHIFRLYDSGSQLNANYLLSTYAQVFANSSLNVTPMDFLKTLLKVRTLFDRYVIRAQGDDEEDENLKWMMLRPYAWWSKEKKTNILHFRNTFGPSTDEARVSEKEEHLRKRIVMQESLLQVTFRNRKYKNWLFALLQWLEPQDVDAVHPEDLSAFLDCWMMDYYQELEQKTVTEPPQPWAFEALGTDTPHFIFNYIDYLYWVVSKNRKANVRYLDEVTDFNFRYYNSVEHHLPQSYEDTDDVNVDNIGNLCLISRRKNSSLNDKAPKEKARLEPGLQPKRKIMYTITQELEGRWSKKQILDHYQDIRNLLDHASDILQA